MTDDLETCSIGASDHIRFVQKMTLGWPCPAFMQGQTVDYSNSIVACDIKVDLCY